MLGSVGGERQKGEACMNARRLTLVIASAVLILSLMTSYLGTEEATAIQEKIPVATAEPIPTVPGAGPGEIGWASWHAAEPTGTQEPASPILRDIRAEERRFENLPLRVRERLERDYIGLDVALPRRNR